MEGAAAPGVCIPDLFWVVPVQAEISRTEANVKGIKIFIYAIVRDATPRHDEIPDTLTTHRAGGYEKAAEHKENIDGDAPDELVADKLQEKIARPTPGHRRSMPIDDRQRSEQPHNVHAVVASIEDRAQCVIVHYVSAKKSDYPGKPQQA